MLKDLQKEISRYKDPVRARHSEGFFKTGKGQYGEGDVFIGLTMPQLRTVSKKYLELGLVDIKKLLDSKYHEYRMSALLILVDKYKKGSELEKKQYFDFYLKNAKLVNNWDLVDTSAHKIVGDYLLDHDRKVLYKLATSSNLWEKRISIISTFAFIPEGQLQDSLKISEILLNDNHDLIHKAVGWVLRVVGKKDMAAEESFLKKHYKTIPRTMLRYAIEKFPEKKRQAYLKGTI